MHTYVLVIYDSVYKYGLLPEMTDVSSPLGKSWMFSS